MGISPNPIERGKPGKIEFLITLIDERTQPVRSRKVEKSPLQTQS
jgi:hypothetical protein